MVYADLHAHTTRSDGSLTLDTLSAAAREAGVSVVAVTDHDRLHPDIEPPVDVIDNLTVVRGIELRVETPRGQRVDLLGYGARGTTELTTELDRIQRDRIGRGRAMVERCEDRLGVDLGLTVEEGFGRPHLARAIEAHPETGLSYEDAFDELIGNDGPCFVARDVTPFEEGRQLLDDACGLVGLAHPLRYAEPEAALALTADLDAVERFYPYGRPVDTAPVDRVIRDHDLIATGGTDAHDMELGRAGLDEDGYRPIATALGRTEG